MRRRSVLVVALLALGAGCGESNEVEEIPAADRETVFDPLTDTLDRARGVEDTLLESAEARRRQLEEGED